MSETHIKDSVSSLIERNYPNYENYKDNPEKYLTDERPLEEVFAIGNIVYHNHNKQTAIENVYINKSVIVALSESETQNLKKELRTPL